MEFFSLEQLKKLDDNKINNYCGEIRKYLIDNVMRSGGHLASNLGIVEISVAVMRVFSPPEDKIIYDVGHQSYVHKLLTGRYFTAETLRHEGGFSGFTKREESEYDCFGAGHSSTALSAAIGFSAASRLKNDTFYTVAIVGDGAFSGGMNLEALNNAEGSKKLIIILNDNEMSISRNVGGMAHYFNKIRTADKYFKLKRKSRKVLSLIPILGKPIEKTIIRLKGAVKRAILRTNFFEELGIDYLGPADGNDIQTVERLLREAKLNGGPVLVHLCTKKGMGYTPAEEKPEKFHAVKPAKNNNETFTSVFSNKIVLEAENNENIVAITAAMSEGVGLEEFNKRYPERFFDVGIAEEHGMTFAAGLAAAGFLPVFALYSTFFQRCYDQILHDISLQKLKVVTVLANSGIVGEDGPTHHGLFDVSMVLNLPNVSVFSPATKFELEKTIEEAFVIDHASIIRYPKGGWNDEIYRLFENKVGLSHSPLKKSDVLFISYGRICENVIRASQILENDGVLSSVIKYLCIKPVDISILFELLEEISPKLICFVEEGMKIGGFSEYIVSRISEKRSLYSKVKIIAVEDEYIPFGRMSYLYDYCGFTAEKISDAVKKELEK